MNAVDVDVVNCACAPGLPQAWTYRDCRRAASAPGRVTHRGELHTAWCRGLCRLAGTQRHARFQWRRQPRSTASSLRRTQSHAAASAQRRAAHKARPRPGGTAPQGPNPARISAHARTRRMMLTAARRYGARVPLKYACLGDVAASAQSTQPPHNIGSARTMPSRVVCGRRGNATQARFFDSSRAWRAAVRRLAGNEASSTARRTSKRCEHDQRLEQPEGQAVCRRGLRRRPLRAGTEQRSGQAARCCLLSWGTRRQSVCTHLSTSMQAPRWLQSR